MEVGGCDLTGRPLEPDGRVIIRRRLGHDAEELICLRRVELNEIVNSLHLHVGVLLDSLRPFFQTLGFEGFQLRAREQAFHHRVQSFIGAVIAHRLHKLQVGGVVAGNEIVPFFSIRPGFFGEPLLKGFLLVGV